ncbi:MAG: hypothetical protein NWE93_00720 [Candidatus Bathyarchaeota archaeon]|nr:hypothetical protein [Candidatus Bathyarchaeota archaeon]
MGITYNAATNTITVTGYTSGVPCTFMDLYNADEAGGWGVVSKQGVNQYLFNAKLYIGDSTGSVATYFADKNVQVTFADFLSAGEVFVYICAAWTNTYATFGVLHDESTKSTSDGCDFFFLTPANYQYAFISQWGVDDFNINFYSCTFKSVSSASSVYIFGSRVWNCYFDRGVTIETLSANGSLYNFQMHGAGVGSGLNLPLLDGVTCEELRIINAYQGLAVLAGSKGTYSVSNIFMRNNFYDFSFYGASVVTSIFLVNCDCDGWVFNWADSTPITVYRQYEFNLTLRESDCTPIEGASVKLSKGAVTLELETDQNGQIATQALTHGYFDQAHGSTEQDTENWTLNIEADGYMPYTASFPITEKTRLQVAPKPQLSGTAVPSDVAAGKTFYGDDVDSMLTGEHVNPAVFVDVSSGKPVLNLNRGKLDNQLVLGL